MDTKEFFKTARIGDEVELQPELTPGIMYGVNTYVSGMLSPGMTGTITRLWPQNKNFTIQGSCYLYTPEMVSHTIDPHSRYRNREKKILTTLGQSRKSSSEVWNFVEKNLLVGDVVRVSGIAKDSAFYSNGMLAPGRTAKIVASTFRCEGSGRKVRVFTLDKEMKGKYTVELFDCMYVISRNDNVYQAFLENFDKEQPVCTVIGPSVQDTATVHIDTSEIVQAIDDIMKGLAKLKKAFEKLA